MLCPHLGDTELPPPLSQLYLVCSHSGSLSLRGQGEGGILGRGKDGQIWMLSLPLCRASMHPTRHRPRFLCVHRKGQDRGGRQAGGGACPGGRSPTVSSPGVCVPFPSLPAGVFWTLPFPKLHLPHPHPSIFLSSSLDASGLRREPLTCP